MAWPNANGVLPWEQRTCKAGRTLAGTATLRYKASETCAYKAFLWLHRRSPSPPCRWRSRRRPPWPSLSAWRLWTPWMPPPQQTTADENDCQCYGWNNWYWHGWDCRLLLLNSALCAVVLPPSANDGDEVGSRGDHQGGGKSLIGACLPLDRTVLPRHRRSSSLRLIPNPDAFSKTAFA